MAILSSQRHRRANRSMGAFEAKTHFSELLERVAQGEEIIITKHRQPVARLVPAGRMPREKMASIFRQMEMLRARQRRPKDTATLKDLIEAGRRF